MARKILFFACVLAFVAVGVGVRLQLFTEADQAAATWFESQITQSRTIAALVITQAGSDIVVLAIVALIGISLRRRSPYWLKRLLITVCGGMISNEVLKFIFYRQRPQYAHPILHLYTNSFPSGHTLAATVLFGTLIILTRSLVESKVLRVAVSPLCAGMIVLIAASRIYLGVHYLSDVIGGFLEGIAWISGTGLALDRTVSTSQPHRSATSESS